MRVVLPLAASAPMSARLCDLASAGVSILVEVMIVASSFACDLVVGSLQMPPLHLDVDCSQSQRRLHSASSFFLSVAKKGQYRLLSPLRPSPRADAAAPTTAHAHAASGAARPLMNAASTSTRAPARFATRAGERQTCASSQYARL